MNENIFDNKRIAEGYAKDRPWLHPNVIELIKEELGLAKLFENGMDVGCGAGLSAKALKTICNHVTGVDISKHMVALCEEMYAKEDYNFMVSKAEEIKTERTYDIVTAAGVVNWVNEQAFLANLSNLLQKNAVLVIYDFWVTDKMKDNNRLTKWWQDEFLVQFPKPYRKEMIWTEETLTEGYHMVKQADISFWHSFHKDSFIRFMMTQSHVNEKIASGAISEQSAKAWFAQSLSAVFENDKVEKEVLFSGYIWYIRWVGHGTKRD